MKLREKRKGPPKNPACSAPGAGASTIGSGPPDARMVGTKKNNMTNTKKRENSPEEKRACPIRGRTTESNELESITSKSNQRLVSNFCRVHDGGVVRNILPDTCVTSSSSAPVQNAKAREAPSGSSSSNSQRPKHEPSALGTICTDRPDCWAPGTSCTDRPDCWAPGSLEQRAEKGVLSKAEAAESGLLAPVLCFWDFAAAFPSVAHFFLMLVIRMSRAPMGFINIIEGMYAHNAAFTAGDGTVNLAFWILSGVLQGCPP